MSALGRAEGGTSYDDDRAGVRILKSVNLRRLPGRGRLRQLQRRVPGGPAQAGIGPNPDPDVLVVASSKANVVPATSVIVWVAVVRSSKGLQRSVLEAKDRVDRIVGTVIREVVVGKDRCRTAFAPVTSFVQPTWTGAQVFHGQRGRQDVGLRLRGCAESHQRGARQRGDGEGAEASAVGARQRLCAGRSGGDPGVGWPGSLTRDRRQESESLLAMCAKREKLELAQQRLATAGGPAGCGRGSTRPWTSAPRADEVDIAGCCRECPLPPPPPRQPQV